MELKIIKCYVKALKNYFKYGSFIPHIYKDVSTEETIIIATDTSFRTSTSFEHMPNEKVYPKVLLVTSECVCCGKKMYSWYRNQADYGKESWSLN